VAEASRQSGQDGVPAEKLAELLSQNGKANVSPDDIRSDVQAGCPILPNGDVPLLPYIRWLHTQVVTGAV
jgi:hypothetical protein